MGISINSNFDSGNIEVIDAKNPDDIKLRIRSDPYCESDKTAHFQWFYFRVSGVKGTELTLRITNAGQSSFPEAWPGYRACASYSKNSGWFRTDTSWDEKLGVITISLKSEQDSVYFAYFAPYPYTRHQDLTSELQMAESVDLEVIGQTVQGRDLDLLKIGESGKGKRVVWIVARQHPGESMAAWFMEGLLHTLVDSNNPYAKRMLKHAVFYVVSNMNPDGSVLGHLRTNAAGANLNREWKTPTLEKSPEVYWVMERMEATGVDLFIDVHGDEEIPFNFLAGEEGIPSFDSRLKVLSTKFASAFERATPDFQAKPGYDVDEPGKANMDIASNAVGEKFKCLSMTLEMPFKDTEDSPDSVHGWSLERAMHFGSSILAAIYEVLPTLR